MTQNNTASLVKRLRANEGEALGYFKTLDDDEKQYHELGMQYHRTRFCFCTAAQPCQELSDSFTSHPSANFQESLLYFPNYKQAYFDCFEEVSEFMIFSGTENQLYSRCQAVTEHLVEAVRLRTNMRIHLLNMEYRITAICMAEFADNGTDLWWDGDNVAPIQSYGEYRELASWVETFPETRGMMEKGRGLKMIVRDHLFGQLLTKDGMARRSQMM